MRAVRRRLPVGLAGAATAGFTPPQLDSGAVSGTDRAERLIPTAEQAAAIGRLKSAIAAGGFAPFLIHGVTGSGKTEVYLTAIEQVVALGRETIVLVPEISLTPQTIERFSQRFGKVSVLHSHLSDAERHRYWQTIASGEVQVIVGARSAVFAPARRLGLIVIDEEHESTFKQETAPRYHARDVGVKRAQLEGIPVLLGSATPSLESWHNAQLGRYSLISMPFRVSGRSMPGVEIIDLRTEKAAIGCLSQPLREAMQVSLAAGGQVILLLNRRGFHTFALCPRCGEVVKCHACDVAMTYHKKRHILICHTCDAERPCPPACPRCRAPKLYYGGIGTERLEREIQTAFPDVASRRMDSDTMRGSGSHERVLRAFQAGEVRILLGTQMIAKGLDFPNVTLVGVVSADTALHLPDFRAAERTFQLMAQVAGRTGRGDRPGRVIVQTFSPEHPAIQLAARHDFVGFAEIELPVRKSFGVPPYGRLVRVIARGSNEASVRAYMDELADAFGAAADPSVRILGPAPRRSRRSAIFIASISSFVARTRSHSDCWLASYLAKRRRRRASRLPSTSIQSPCFDPTWRPSGRRQSRNRSNFPKVRFTTSRRPGIFPAVRSHPEFVTGELTDKLPPVRAGRPGMQASHPRLPSPDTRGRDEKGPAALPERASTGVVRAAIRVVRSTGRRVRSLPV